MLSAIRDPLNALTTRRLFTAILFIALFVITTREIADPDFWWHLSTGKYIVATQSIPHTDPFSFTRSGQSWVTHEWLSEVFIYALFLIGSYPLIIVIFSAIITLAFALVWARSPGKPYVATVAVLLGAFAAAPTWGARPQIISLLLMSVFLFILDQRRDLRWTLVPLMLLWVNLHSGYALGIVIIGIYLFGEIVAFIASRHFASSLRSLIIIFILCLVAVLINPNGATMFVYPFETLTSPTMQAYIQEWFSPDFHLVEFQPFAWLLLATIAAIALSGKRASLTQTLLLVGTGYAGLRSARNIPLFAIVAAPILAEHLWHTIETNHWDKFLAPAKIQMTRGMAILNWLTLSLIVSAGAIRVGMVIDNQSTIERSKFPAAAVDFLQAQNISGAIYNSYDWGGYLIWRFSARPPARVFIDGRADVYGDKFIEDVYLKPYRGGSGWREPLDQYNVRVVLVEPTAPIVAQLARDPAWRQIYVDKQAVIFVR